MSTKQTENKGPTLRVIIEGGPSTGKSTLAMIIARALDVGGVDDVTVYDDSTMDYLVRKPGIEALKGHTIVISPKVSRKQKLLAKALVPYSTKELFHRKGGGKKQ